MISGALMFLVFLISHLSLNTIPHLPSHQIPSTTVSFYRERYTSIPWHQTIPIYLPSQFPSEHSTNPTTQLLVTRSHKMNDREHQVESATGPRENIPRYFAKSGPTDADPRKTKKDGGGKGNW